MTIRTIEIEYEDQVFEVRFNLATEDEEFEILHINAKGKKGGYYNAGWLLDSAVRVEEIKDCVIEAMNNE